MVLPESIRYELVDTVRNFMLAVLIPILLVLTVRVFLVGQYMIPSGSMENTLEVEDRVLTSQNLTLNLAKLQRGDVIVFHDPADWLSGESASNAGDDFLIKRLIGLPGDRVSCAGRGEPVKVNGVAIDESSYVKAGVQPSSFAFAVTVPAGHLFVLGDNRADSADSRYHVDDGAQGTVPVENVAGVALATCWPLSRFKRLDNQHGPFASVPDINQSVASDAADGPASQAGSASSASVRSEGQ
nr:signal peptidase I [Bifidobacterium actinocoloniiforme]